MKKMNLTYVMFGVFLLIVITVIACNRCETETISLPMPEVIIEEVKDRRFYKKPSVKKKEKQIRAERQRQRDERKKQRALERRRRRDY